MVKEAEDLLKKQEEAMKQSAEAASRPSHWRASRPRACPTRSRSPSSTISRPGKSDIAKGLQSLESKMDDLVRQRTDPSDPLAAGTLKDAADKSRKQGTAAKMSDASQGLAKNQMGAARDRPGEGAARISRNLVDSVKDRRCR